MNYTKIRLDFKYGPKNRFYRVVLVKGDPDLFKLGVELGTAVGAMFEHCFLITCNRRKTQYVMAPFMEDPIDGYKYLGNYHLSDLPDNFDYEYDTGDGWDFSCKKYKQKVEVKSKKNIILIDGAGQGIWEDHICTLFALFNGEIDPDCDEEDEENGIYKPWNAPIDKYGDFDLPLDIEDINETLDESFIFDYEESLTCEKEFIEQTNVCLDDYTKEYNPRLKNALIQAVEEQISNLVYVREIFEKLEAIHGEVRAKDAIASVLTEYIFELETKHKDFKNKEYKNKLEKLLKQ